MAACLRMRSMICLPVNEGCVALMSAAMPVMCGAAMEVPLVLAYPLGYWAVGTVE